MEAGILAVQGHLWLHSRFEASLRDMGLCLKTTLNIEEFFVVFLQLFCKSESFEITKAQGRQGPAQFLVIWSCHRSEVFGLRGDHCIAWSSGTGVGLSPGSGGTLQALFSDWNEKGEILEVTFPKAHTFCAGDRDVLSHSHPSLPLWLSESRQVEKLCPRDLQLQLVL